MTGETASLQQLFGLGNAFKSQGKLDEAVATYRELLVRSPDFLPALYNLGAAFAAQGHRDQAIAALARAVAVKPDFAQAHNNLGILHYEVGQWAAAEAAFIRALALQPQFFQAHNNLGMVRKKSGKPAEAEFSYREALRINPGYTEAHDNLGALLLEMGRTDEAFAQFMRRAAVVQEPESFSPQRRKHDLEQAAYRGRPVEARIEIEGGERIEGSAINPANQTHAIEAVWKGAQPQLVVIDDLLTPEALEGLRRFCHGSTIWRENFDGYLGARLQSGFACPLLAQVAEEFARAYPAIFQDHPLMFAWSFKYEQGLRGTKVHADFAAVNVNFWITPDSANRDPSAGGLLVWDAAAPLDWDFARYNANDDAIREYLRQSGAKPTRIPYRANRAVVFDSDLFHETDTMAFRPGYTDRRINITLLYGSRTKGALQEL
jgi:Tfp pilus assembly protein PilF